jgi:hypothetical protein
MVFIRWESILARRQGYQCSVHLGPGDAGEGHAVRPKVTRLQRSVGYDAMAVEWIYLIFFEWEPLSSKVEVTLPHATQPKAR